MARGSGTSAIVALAMAGSEDQALTIARALVLERLAACVNIVAPVRSIYRWRGTIEDEAEWMLMIKTRANLFPDLERRVRQLHSYEVPEVIALRIAFGSRPYLDWLMESSGPEPKRRKRGTR